MALIACPECNNQISDRALSCPSCGVPVGTTERNDGVFVTTQETAKRLKLHLMMSGVLASTGVLIAMIIAGSGGTQAEDYSPGPWAALAVLTAVVGFGWFLVTKMRIWWHHR